MFVNVEWTNHINVPTDKLYRNTREKNLVNFMVFEQMTNFIWQELYKHNWLWYFLQCSIDMRNICSHFSSVGARGDAANDDVRAMRLEWTSL